MISNASYSASAIRTPEIDNLIIFCQLSKYDPSNKLWSGKLCYPLTYCVGKEQKAHHPVSDDY